MILYDIICRSIPSRFSILGPEVTSRLLNDEILSQVDRRIYPDPVDHPWRVRAIILAI
jgi:hypothetical protein